MSVALLAEPKAERDRFAERGVWALALIGAGGVNAVPNPPPCVSFRCTAPNTFSIGPGLLLEGGQEFGDSIAVLFHLCASGIGFVNLIDVGPQVLFALSEHVGLSTGLRAAWFLSTAQDLPSAVTIVAPVRVQWTPAPRTQLSRRGFTLFFEVAGGLGLPSFPSALTFTAMLGAGYAVW